MIIMHSFLIFLRKNLTLHAHSGLHGLSFCQNFTLHAYMGLHAYSDTRVGPKFFMPAAVLSDITVN